MTPPRVGPYASRWDPPGWARTLGGVSRASAGSEAYSAPGHLPRTSLPARTLRAETLLVLGVGLGASAVWSVLAIVNRLTLEVALAEQSSSLNSAVTPDRPWLDLLYQLVRIGLLVVPALLAVHLLRRDDPRAPRLVGWDLRRPGHDLAMGALLAAGIGVPGLGFYLGARALGVNTTVSAAGLGEHWWTVPVLMLASVANAVLEEVTLLAYLVTRWQQARGDTGATAAATPERGGLWGSLWRSLRPVLGVVVASALLRGAYHLYQGFGGFAGNVLMGLLLGAVYARTRRVMPMVVAHTLIDVVAFVGYALLAGSVSWL